MMLIGSFAVASGPRWWSNPETYSCVEACALLFGGTNQGNTYTYHCSTSSTTLDYTAWTDSWGGDGCQVHSETYKLNSYYDCGSVGCSVSAYVSDHSCWQTNYCFREEGAHPRPPPTYPPAYPPVHLPLTPSPPPLPPSGSASSFNGVNQTLMFAWGLSAGDTSMHTDDGSAYMALPAPLPFGNTTHQSLYISNNGYVYFSQMFLGYYAPDLQFAAEQHLPLDPFIAAFFTDLINVDTPTWYRVSTSPADLQRAQELLRSDNTPAYVAVVTW